MLYLHTNYEKVLVTVSEDELEFHLALSSEISLLRERDFLVPIFWSISTLLVKEMEGTSYISHFAML